MLHRCLTLLLVVCLGLPHPSLYAQSASLDLDPPDLEHTPLDNTSGTASEIIRLNASDQQGLKDISLYYRFSSDETYSAIPMQATGIASTYESIVRLPRSSSTIYYYFEAVDISGNRVLDGYPFSPYTRNIQFTDTSAAVGSGPSTEPPVAAETQATTTRKPWMLLLGLLVVGALVAGSSSGGSSSSDGGGDPAPSDPDSPTVPVNLTVPLP